jgi:hypothetical protein
MKKRVKTKSSISEKKTKKKNHNSYRSNNQIGGNSPAILMTLQRKEDKETIENDI